MPIRATYRTVWSSNAKTLYLLPSLIVNWGPDHHLGNFVHFRFLIFWFCIGWFKRIDPVPKTDPKTTTPPKPKSLTEMIFKNGK